MLNNPSTVNIEKEFRGRDRVNVGLHHWQIMPLPTLKTKTALPVLKHRQSEPIGRTQPTVVVEDHTHSPLRDSCGGGRALFVPSAVSTGEQSAA
jgi:hypothetical protein